MIQKCFPKGKNAQMSIVPGNATKAYLICNESRYYNFNFACHNNLA